MVIVDRFMRRCFHVQSNPTINTSEIHVCKKKFQFFTLRVSSHLPKKLQHFVQHFDAVRNVRASGGEALHALHFGLHEHGLVLITARHKVRGSITVPAGRAMRPRRYFRLRQLLTALQCTDLYTKILQPNCCNNESSETAFAAAIVTSLQWCEIGRAHV